MMAASVRVRHLGACRVSNPLMLILGRGGFHRETGDDAILTSRFLGSCSGRNFYTHFLYGESKTQHPTA